MEIASRVETDVRRRRRLGQTQSEERGASGDSEDKLHHGSTIAHGGPVHVRGKVWGGEGEGRGGRGAETVNQGFACSRLLIHTTRYTTDSFPFLESF